MAKKTRFDKALRAIQGVPLRETCHRIVALSAYEAGRPKALLHDDGPRRCGQRFSPPGDHRGLYVAVERETAGSEFAGSLEAWSKGECVTSVLFKVRVKLKSVLDLSDPAILSQLKLTPAQVRGAWEGYQALFQKEPLTWILGRAIHASKKFDGILYPSIKHPAGRCLLIFTGHLKAGTSEVVLLDDEGNILECLPD